MPDASLARNRRVIGLAMLAFAAIMAVVAVLIVTETIPLAEQARTIVTVALGAAALVDALIGVRFLLTSSE